jgi:HSP20 family protein
MANISVKNQEGGTGTLARPRSAQGWDPLRAARELLRWDPFREMAPSWSGDELMTFAPAFEVKETQNAYVFKADLPGVREEDLDITRTGNRLTISGKREAEQEEKGNTYYAYERSYGSFTRSFTLPEGIDEEHINAQLKDGVLELNVPKKAEAQPKKIGLRSALGMKSAPTPEKH